ncbi:MAG: transposase, partial [Luteimonas sp.]
MPMNRVQFQPGLSLSAFLQHYGTQAACEDALLRSRWPDGFVCPRCAGQAHSTFTRGGRRFWQCRACRTQTSLRAGTVFDHSKLPLTTWLLAVYLLTQSKNNISALELKRHLGVCYRTAWRLKHKLIEPPRFFRRLPHLRRWGHEEVNEVFCGSARASGSVGAGVSGRA